MNVEKAIWAAYRDNPCRLFSIRELSLHLKKSYPLIHQHTTRLIQDKKLLTKKLGKSILCYPNYHHSYTLLSLALADQENTSQISRSNPDAFALYNFFSTKIVPGLLSAWISQEQLVLLISNKDVKKDIQNILSHTTFSAQIQFITIDSIAQHISFLVSKSFVIYGYEQYHQMIRLEYQQFASYHNVVNLNE